MVALCWQRTVHDFESNGPISFVENKYCRVNAGTKKPLQNLKWNMGLDKLTQN